MMAAYGCDLSFHATSLYFHVTSLNLHATSLCRVPHGVGLKAVLFFSMTVRPSPRTWLPIPPATVATFTQPGTSSLTYRQWRKWSRSSMEGSSSNPLGCHWALCPVPVPKSTPPTALCWRAEIWSMAGCHIRLKAPLLLLVDIYSRTRKKAWRLRLWGRY